MQDIWRLKLDWDESIPLDLNTKWKQYERELHNSSHQFSLEEQACEELFKKGVKHNTDGRFIV